MSDLPKAEIIYCRYNGHLKNSFVIGVMCPYANCISYHVIDDAELGEEIFVHRDTITKGREKIVARGHENGYFIGGALNLRELPPVTMKASQLANTRTLMRK